MIRTLVLSGLLALPAAALPACAAAQSGSQTSAASTPATLSLSATGEVSRAPDIATVTAGVVSEGRTPGEALSANSEKMRGVYGALNRAGITGPDRQTSALSLNPVYSGRYDSGQERRITGYEARNTVTATVRDLDRVGAVLDALVESGANQLQGVNFSIEDPSEARDEARRRAVAELNRVRDLYAEAAGFRTLSLHTMSEGSGRGDTIMVTAARMELAESTPVEAGALTVSVTVNASWLIED